MPAHSNHTRVLPGWVLARADPSNSPLKRKVGGGCSNAAQLPTTLTPLGGLGCFGGENGYLVLAAATSTQPEYPLGGTQSCCTSHLPRGPRQPIGPGPKCMDPGAGKQAPVWVPAKWKTRKACCLLLLLKVCINPQNAKPPNPAVMANHELFNVQEIENSL